MTTIISGDSPSVTFSDGTTQTTSAIVSGKVPYTNLPAGSVLQVVQGINTTSTSTTSGTPVATGLTASITPKFSTSRILVMFTAIGYNSSAGGQPFFFIYRNSSVALGTGNTRLGDLYSSAGGVVANISNSIIDTPATTSATTYTLYIGGGSGTMINGDSGTNQTITLLEIAA